MAYSTTYLYPEDLNGTNPANLITNEPQTLQSPGPEDYYFIIPHAAPFFVDSLIVINAATGLPYVKGDDYQVGHLFIEAMNSIGRPMAGSIRFMRPTITGQVLLTYRTLGGPWGFSDQDILRELSNKLVNPLIRSWGDIAPLPYSFPPLPHDQRINTLIGSAEINETLKEIATILEATAEGTSQSHITDYNNPHRTTAFQVGLGNVPNFLMATDLQHEDANQNNLFTNPRGVLLLVQKWAIAPLNSHITDYNNPHRTDKTHVGLGNVPNWVPATATTALDTTNNSAFMTPYTTSLLVQALNSDPRLDQLIIDFNNHITANNPHGITPSMIGTYTSSQIDQMIASIEQGGNATTFDGETAVEWEAKFPAVADINTILEELTTVYTTALDNLNLLNVEDPVTPAEKAREQAKLLSWAYGEYNAYAIYNSLGDGYIVADTSLASGFPTEPIANAGSAWSATVNGGYLIKPNGGVAAWGSSPVTIPTIYSEAGNPQGANKVTLIYASKDFIYLVLAGGSLVLVTRGGPANGTVVSTGNDLWNMLVNNGNVDNRAFGIMESKVGTANDIWIPTGHASWITAFNGVKSTLTAGGWSIVDMRIANNYLNIVSENATTTKVSIYQINYATNITLTDVTNTIVFTNHTTNATATAAQLAGVTQVAGSYTHFLFTKPITPDSPLTDLYSFGSNTNGQLEITNASGPFYAVGAGDGFTVTINQFHYAEFWGDSPDNSLIWTGGNTIQTD